MTVATSIAVVGAIFAMALLTRPPTHSGPTSSAVRSSDSASTAVRGGRDPVLGKLVFGMTARQVLRIDGRPDKVLSFQGLTCWHYAVNEEFPATSQNRAWTLNAVRVCFDGGRYSISHSEINGKWDLPPQALMNSLP